MPRAGQTNCGRNGHFMRTHKTGKKLQAQDTKHDRGNNNWRRIQRNRINQIQDWIGKMNKNTNRNKYLGTVVKTKIGEKEKRYKIPAFHSSRHMRTF